MPKVQYVGTGHYRVINAGDWPQELGEDRPNKLVWDRDNRGGDNVHPRGKTLAKVHEIPEAAWEWLSENTDDEFELVDDEPTELKPVADSPDASAGLPADAIKAGTTPPGGTPPITTGSSTP